MKNKKDRKSDEQKPLMKEGGDDDEDAEIAVVQFDNHDGEGAEIGGGDFDRPKTADQKKPPVPIGFPNFGIPDEGCCWCWILIILLILIILALIVIILLKATGN